MKAWAVYAPSGDLYSVGSVLADPLPDGFTAVEITAEQFDAVRNGDPDAVSD